MALTYPGRYRLWWWLLRLRYFSRSWWRPRATGPADCKCSYFHILQGHPPRRRPWAISKRRHLDCPNQWCGRYRCSHGLTSLFEGADHSSGKYNRNQSSLPLVCGGGCLHFPSLNLPVTPEGQTSIWPR
ncbi:uncharacterized protein PS065_019248 isoform 2-T3 [Dugong dugon]